MKTTFEDTQGCGNDQGGKHECGGNGIGDLPGRIVPYDGSSDADSDALEEISHFVDVGYLDVNVFDNFVGL